MEAKLAKIEIAGQGGINAQSLLQSAIDKGVPVETMERLVALTKEIRAEIAKEQFNNAMAEFQRACPPIKKTDKANIRTRSGNSYSYSYAPLETIMEVIVPVMAPLGLSVSYRMRHEQGKVVAIARISHQGGHFEESGEVAMPIVVTEYGANPAQCVGIAATYARRYALLAITGIAPQGEDPDGEPGQLTAQNGKQEQVRLEPKQQAAPKPAHSVSPTQHVAARLGEDVGVLERVAIKTSPGGKPYAVFTLNGKKITCWDTKTHPFLIAKENSVIAAVIETKGNFNNLVSCRIPENNAPLLDEEPPITEAPF